VLVIIVLSLLGWAILLILLLRLFNGVTSVADARGDMKSQPVTRSGRLAVRNGRGWLLGS
jgi:hypothetical protein